MAFEKPLVIHSFTAASDMIAATLQYTLVKLLSGETVVTCASATEVPIGVLQNLPKQGQQAEVMVLGITKIRVGTTDIAGASNAFVAVDTNGRAVLASGSAGSQTYILGRVIQVDATDNDGALVTAIINCINPTLPRAF
jgi:hypothetical protein